LTWSLTPVTSICLLGSGTNNHGEKLWPLPLMKHTNRQKQRQGGICVDTLVNTKSRGKKICVSDVLDIGFWDDQLQADTRDR